MADTHNGIIGRRHRTWRRLMLAFGPPKAKQVALALAEFAWAELGDPDGDLIARGCSQARLCQLCDYKDARAVREHIRKLEDAGWIARDDVQTGRGVLREYVLRIPDSVPRRAIDEFEAPTKGMWHRVLNGNTEGSPELPFRRSEAATEKADHRNASAPSPEPECTITGTPAHHHRNPDSALRDVLSKSLDDLGKGEPRGGSPAADKNPLSRKKRAGPKHASEALPDWQTARQAARRALNLKGQT